MSDRVMRRISWCCWVVAVAVLLHLSWMAGSRYLRRASINPVQQETGASGVRILQFYASTGAVTKGERAVVCYGVENAREVKLEPEVKKLEPSTNRCFSVTPASNTIYTLIAEGYDGQQVSASFAISVATPPRSALLLARSRAEFRPDTLPPSQGAEKGPWRSLPDGRGSVNAYADT